MSEGRCRYLDGPWDGVVQIQPVPAKGEIRDVVATEPDGLRWRYFYAGDLSDGEHLFHFKPDDLARWHTLSATEQLMVREHLGQARAIS